MSKPESDKTVRRARILEAQRRRLQALTQDYYPSDAALEIIRNHTHNAVGGDYSSVISRIIQQWARISV